MKSFKVKAIIIKRRNFMEKDRILTLFSQEDGKIEALAKGSRRPGNKLSPNSDIGSIAKFHIHKAKSLDIISEIDPIYHPFGARGEFQKTQKISYALKLIDKVFEIGENHPKTFLALQALIESVAEEDKQLIFLKFLIDVLDELGMMPDLFNCSRCQTKINSSDQYAFAIGSGLTHRDCGTEVCIDVSDKEVKLLRLLQNLSIEETIGYKTDENTYHNAFQLVAEHINHEFGMKLLDEVM